MSGLSLAEPDITLSLDVDGIIRDVTLSHSLSGEAVEQWRGRPWTDTVDDTGTGKVRRMVEDACRNGVSAFRQLTQTFPSGLELPMEFTTVRLGGKAGLIAIGRSLQAVAELQARLVAAQQTMEQDYWKLREVETRYRMLFDASLEAVLLLRAEDLRIIEANRAAIRSLGVRPGTDLLTELAETERDAFQTMLARVREHGRAPGMVAHFGAGGDAWAVRASVMSAEAGQAFLLQLAPVLGTSPDIIHNDQISFDAFVERLPDALVVVDQDGVVRRANRAFLDLVQVGAEGAATGEHLGRWLLQPGADLPVLQANLNRHGVVRLFATRIQGELGSETDVEISAVRKDDAKSSTIALLLRDVGRRLPEPSEGRPLRTALASLIGQPGKTTLPKLVDEAVETVERHYIEAALDMVDGNRTAAAELLGLSRQSLYKKLARYELVGNEEVEEQHGTTM
jgi:transcriptional regulator PpsR